jgi:predicted metal-dependent hydrolase
MKINKIVVRKRIKHAYLKMLSSREVRLSVPLHATDKQINKIFERRESWIIKQQKILKEREKQIQFAEDIIRIMGKDVNVIYKQELMNQYRLDMTRCELFSGRKLDDIDLRGQIYRNLAYRYIKPRVRQLARDHGFSINKVIIRGQVGKWGTCSRKGNISVNWKLMIAPEFVIDSVIMHELVHLQHHNHGKEFWAELRRLFPRTDEAEEWLAQHNSILRMY